MCGIIGIVTNQRRTAITHALQKGTDALTHRGPDDEGVEFLTAPDDPLTVAFGQRRLAILDLSAAGHQPMRHEATGNWITYNGEVFNFHEVRASLVARGHRFRSNSDTEVILQGLSSQGLAAVTDWRGMFALGFWQPNERRLTLLRDRLGIKPLYYFYDGENFIFASEVRALLATGLVPRRLSHAAVESYLSYGSVQQPLTIIENVFALLPGHSLTFANGRIHTAPYWELSADANASLTDEPALTEELQSLLSEAVKLRLVSDVPVGVFLSGGIDSSALVSLMRRATNSAIKSFSVTFPVSEFNEGVYAEQIARQFNTEHQTVTVTESELLTKLPRALAALDQPAVDGFNSYIISEAVAAAGLKVAISGAGGDEVFAGYKFFQRITQSERLRHQLLRVPSPVRRAAASAVSALAGSTRAHKLSSLLRSEHLDDHSVYLQRRLFTDEQQRRLLLGNSYPANDRGNDALKNWSQRQAQAALSPDVINQASVLELGGYLSNTLLRDTDTMSMAHSLEVRVPLIDHRLVEFMLRVPGNLKVRANEPKRLLVNAVADLPDEIVHRPKRGFELPFKHWLRNELRTEVEREFNETPLRYLLHIPALTALWNDFQQGRLTWSRVWSLYVLSRWAGLNLADVIV